MSQRDSGYERIPRDAYATPAWVTHALRPHIDVPDLVWEPAAGEGKMVAALKEWGCDVMSSDIDKGQNFFHFVDATAAKAIITNPPYADADRFIEHALACTEWGMGIVAMLLRADFDHGASRKHLFADCTAFAKKVVLTRRIRWFEGTKGSPSFNHAWFIWNHRHVGPPVIAYGP